MDDVENPEDANELDIYKRLRDIERRLDQLDEKHDKLRDDYKFKRGGRRKTRRKKNKKKRHIITRKKKRKRRRRTKKRRKGGMPKNSTQSKPIAQLKKSTFRPLKESKSLGSRLKKSSSFRSGLNTLANRASPSTKMFKTAPIETQLANLDLSSPQQSQQPQKQQQTSKSKE